MPIVYKQMKLLYKIWDKSNDPFKHEMMLILKSAMKEIEQEYSVC